MTQKQIDGMGKRALSKSYNDALEKSLRDAKRFLKAAKDVQSGRVKPPPGYKTEKQIEGWKRAYMTRALKKADAVAKITDEMIGAGVKARKSIVGTMEKLYGIENRSTLKILNGIDRSGLIPLKQNEIRVLLMRTQTAFDKAAFDNLSRGKGVPALLRREFAAGILRGDSDEELAKRIRDITGRKLYEANRILRTEKTRIQGEAMQKTAEDWQEATGRGAWKRWHCSFHNSRDTHMAMDGQTVRVEDRFRSPSGATFAYPGDGSEAPVGEVVNCNCWMEIVGEEEL